MKRYNSWIKSFYAILFMLSMVLPLIPVPTQADDPLGFLFPFLAPPQGNTDASTGEDTIYIDGVEYSKGEELIGDRTAVSKTVYLGNGEYQTLIFNGVVHYKDNYGSSIEEWKDIDLTMVDGKVTKAPYELTVNGLDVTIRDKKTGSVVYLKLTDVGTSKISVPTLSIGKGIATAKDIATDTDLEIAWSNARISYTRILKSVNAPTDAKYSITQTGTGLELSTKAVDSKATFDKSVAVISAIKDGVLTESIDTSKVSLTYPVRIDPTVVPVDTTASDAYISSDLPPGSTYAAVHNDDIGNAPAGGTSLYIGQQWFAGMTIFQCFRTVLYFDTSVLPDTAIVSSANVTIFGNTYHSADKNINIQVTNGQTHYPHDPPVAADYNKTNYTGDGGTFPSTSYNVTGYNAIPLNATGISWISNTVPTKLYLVSDDDYDAVQPINFYEWIAAWSFEKGVGYIPYLSVEYSLAVPVITTNAALNVAETTATLSGNASAVSGVSVAYRGFAWGTSANATTPSSGEAPPASYTTSNITLGNYTFGELVDPFDNNAFDTTKFTESTNVGSLVAEQNNRLELTSAAAVSGFVRSTNSYQLAESQTSIKVSQASTDGGFKLCPTLVVDHMWDVYSEANWYNFQFIAGGAVRVVRNNTGVATTLATSGALTTPYWLRMRVTGGVIYFEYANNTATKPAETGWTVLASEAWNLGVPLTTAEYIYLASYNTPATGSSYVTNFEFNTIQLFSYPVTGLLAETPYYYRATANTTTGWVWGDEVLFTLSPVAYTNCTGRGGDWATFQVEAVSASTLSNIAIEYGRTTAYGSTYSRAGTWHTGDKVYFTIRNLTPATPYHFRARITSSVGLVSYGLDDTFATTGSPSLYEFLNTGGGLDSAPIYGVNQTYQTFLVGDVSHMVTSIRLPLARVGAPSYVTVSIKHANAAGDEPTGEDLATVLLNGSYFNTVPNWYKFDFTTIVSLEANTSYAIVVSALGGYATDYIIWDTDAGGGLVDANNGISTDGGVTWTPDTDDQLFELWGYPSLRVLSANVFTGYISTGDWLVMAEIENTYPPYYNDNADPSVFFYVQLVNSTTGVVEASVPCTSWSRSPVGIYVTPAQVTGSLTWGGTYNVRLYCSVTGDYQEYPLSDMDWRGNDLAYLDQWVRVTAASMQSYYGVSLLTSDQTKEGKLILNSAGGVFFTRGLPTLPTIRPEMFSDVGGAITPHSEGSFTKGYEVSRDWRTSLGATIGTLISSWGNVMGVDTTDTAKTDTFAGILFIVAYIILLFVLGADKIDGWLAIILALPFIVFGLYVGLIAMTYVFGLALLAVAIRLFSWLTP